jgi:hypothetical protein
MSCAINVDRISPKNSASVTLGTSLSGVIQQPYTESLSAPVNVGSFLNVATQTGTITMLNGTWYLSLEQMTLPNTIAYAGSAATCDLLTSSIAKPNENVMFQIVISSAGFKNIGVVRVLPNGTVTYYKDVNLGGMVSNQIFVLYRCVVNYR